MSALVTSEDVHPDLSRRFVILMMKKDCFEQVEFACDFVPALDYLEFDQLPMDSLFTLCL